MALLQGVDLGGPSLKLGLFIHVLYTCSMRDRSVVLPEEQKLSRSCEDIRIARDIRPIVHMLLLPDSIPLATASHKVGFKVKVWGDIFHLLSERDMKGP